MLNENQSLSDDTGDDRKSNPCRRRRSSSLGSKRNIKGNNFLRDSNRSEQLQKYASSGQLFNNSENMADNDSLVYSPRTQNKFSAVDIFVKWSTDPKWTKNELTRLYENNIFKTGFHMQEKYNSNDYYPPVMFLISHNLKIDNEYEIYTINNYDVSLGELMTSLPEDSDIYKEYHKGFNAITQTIVDIAKTDFIHSGNVEKKDGEMNNNRRHSEIMGLIIANKTQSMSYFLPNKTSTGFEVVIKVGDVYVIDQARKSDKVLRHIILTNDVLSIFATKKAERLKYKFFLKHLYCEICTDHQIQNIDSSLRIGGPFGDDLILTFSNPNSRNEWLTAIQNYMSILLETFKSHSTEITIYKNLEPNSSAPLVCKTFSITGLTKGLELKKKAIEGFNTMEKSVSDFILTFTVSSTGNREYNLNDDVPVMILQEHLGCFADSTGCNEKCIGNTNLPSRNHFYLKYNPTRDMSRNRKPKTVQEFKPAKSNRFILNEQWPNNVLPEVIKILLSDVYHEGSQTEGIFRIPGSITRSDALLLSICNNDNIEIKEEIHTKANALKKFLGSIEGSIFTSANKEKLTILSHEIVSLEEFSKNPDQIKNLLSMIQTLPPNNYSLLQHFLVVINQISKNDAISKMNRSNLAVCLAPTVLTDMFDMSPSEYPKFIIVFECILSLVDKIVDEATRKKIVSSLKERRRSIDSNCASIEDNSVALTNESAMSTTGSDNVDETDGIVKPSVPPRRRRLDIDNISNKEFPPANCHSGAQRLVIKKALMQEMHKSSSDEKSADTVDGARSKNEPIQNEIASAGQEKVKMRYQTKKRNSRDRHTVAVTADNESRNDSAAEKVTRTPEEIQSCPFRRQGQVNRKHRDNSITNYNIHLDEQKPIDNTLQLSSPSVDQQPQSGGRQRLARSNNPVMNPQEKRSRVRTPHENVNDKSKSTNEHFVLIQKRASIDGSNLEHRRSSSSSRVTKMAQDYDKNVNRNNVSARTPESGNTQRNKELPRLVRKSNVIPKTSNRSPRNIPIQPSHDIGGNLVKSPKKPASVGVRRSNTMEMTLKETIETSDDKNVMII